MAKETILLRVPLQLKQTVKAEADKAGLSVNVFVRLLLIEALEKKEATK